MIAAINTSWGSQLQMAVPEDRRSLALAGSLGTTSAHELSL